MTSHTALSTALAALGHGTSPSVADGHASLLCSDTGQPAATVARVGSAYALLTLPGGPDGAVAARALLEAAVLPMADEFAVAPRQREDARKKLVAAVLALEGLAKAQAVRVPAVVFEVHQGVADRVKELEERGVKVDVEALGEFGEDVELLNQLQALVGGWGREIERVVAAARDGPGVLMQADEEALFWASVDSAFESAERKLAEPVVRLSLQLLARKRRVAAFMSDSSDALQRGRQRAKGILNLVQSLPVAPLRTADDLPALTAAVRALLSHVASRLRLSSFPLNRALALVSALSQDVDKSLARVLVRNGGLLGMSHKMSLATVGLCEELFRTWDNGFESCRRAAVERAEARGERIEPRPRPAFTPLQTRIRHVSTFRTHHEALRAVLSAVRGSIASSPDAAVSTEIDETTAARLDEAYDVVVAAFGGSAILDVTQEGESEWNDALGAYAATLDPIELALASDWESRILGASTLQAKATIGADYLPVIDREVFAEQTAKSMAGLTKLAREAIAGIRSKSAQWTGPTQVDAEFVASRGIPPVSYRVMSLRQLSSAVDGVLVHMRGIVGEVRMDTDLDLRDLVSECDALRTSLDPVRVVSQWVDSLTTNALDAPGSIFAPTLAHGLRLSVDENVAGVPDEVATLSDLGFGGASEPVVEFAKRVRIVHPAFSILSEAVHAYKVGVSAASRLRKQEPGSYRRVARLFRKKKRAVRSLFEEGTSMLWVSSPGSLVGYARCLQSAACAFSDAVVLAVDRDALIQASVRSVSSLQCSVSADGIHPEDSKQLAEFLGEIEAAFEDMHSCRALCEVSSWYKPRVVYPHVLRAMQCLLKRVICSWEASLKCGALGLPSISLTYSEKGFVELSSPLQVLEGRLYESLFLTIGGICRVKGAPHVGKNRATKDGSHLGQDVDSKLFARLFKSNGSQGPFIAGASQLIRTVVQNAENTLGKWRSFEGLMGIDANALVNSSEGSTLQSWNNVFSSVFETREAIQCLMSSSSKAGGEYEGMPFDVSLAGRTVLDRIDAIVGTLSEKSSVVVSEELAATYALANETLAVVRDSGSVDPMDHLLLMKTARDDILPTCSVKSEQLHKLMGFLRGTPGYSLVGTVTDLASVSAAVASLKLELEQRERHTSDDRPALEARYNAELGALEVELADLFGDVSQHREESAGSDDAAKVLRDLADMETRLSNARGKCSHIQAIAGALNLPEPSNDMELDTLAEELREMRFAMSEAAAIETELETLGKSRLGTFEPKAARQKLDNLGERLRELQAARGGLALAHKLESVVAQRLQLHNLVSSLRTAKLSAPREREVVEKLLGEAAVDTNLYSITLKELWQSNLERHERYLRTVFESAAGESSLASFLASLADVWTFRRVEFASRGRVKLIRGIPGLLDDASEHLHALSAMSGSPHARLFEAERASWELRICKFRDEVEVWGEVQTRWLHLHALFDESSPSSGSLRRELRQEFASFKSVQARLAEFSSRAQAAPGILEVLEKASGLDRMAIELTAVVRGLGKFLENQRSVFPRFFYLSDEDLLSVLSISYRDVLSISPHLSKLFPGVARLHVDKDESLDNSLIVAVVSKEGEVLGLVNPIEIGAKDHVTSWLHGLDRQIQESLRVMFPSVLEHVRELMFEEAKSSSSLPGPLGKLLQSNPAQLVLLAAKVAFTSSVDFALAVPGDEALAKLDSIVVRIDNTLRMVTDLECPKPCLLPGRFRQVREQVIKELVLERSIVQSLLQRSSALVSAGEVGVGDYRWFAQLRFYAAVEDRDRLVNVRAEMADASSPYGWEYLGVGETLVQTSLTRRCFLALMQAVKRGLGGSPFGPAGTGKTESVKALGSLLGRSVAVFNCDETFDAVSVGRILAGVCRTGSWVCFDEFNRLSAGILSSTSNQLATLQAAIQNQEPTIPNFYGGSEKIVVSSGVAVFVTMNPTYSGRRELPANLQTLFRPFAMAKPDSNVIAEVSLLAQGFLSSDTLAPQLVECFEKFYAGLPERQHYDFGLRSLKSAIDAAGTLLRSCSRQLGGDGEMHREGHCVVRALLETVKPKIVPEDTDLFECIVRQVFPGIDLSIPPLPEALLAALQVEAELSGVLLNDSLLEKIGQLYKILQYRVGVMLVGSSGAGKTVTWQLLRKAMYRAAVSGIPAGGVCSPFPSVALQGCDPPSTPSLKVPSAHVVDPKLLSSSELYGSLDITTREWTDGIFTRTLRQVANQDGCDGQMENSGIATGGVPGGVYDWIVFDGDVDPDWAENLNSVLDDSRVLTLPTGERIPLHPSIRIVFEAVDVKAANPSTISRCGMVCFSPPETLNAVALRLLEVRASRTSFWSACMGIVRGLVPIAVDNVEGVGSYQSSVMKISPFGVLDAIFALFDASLLRFANHLKETRLNSSDPEKVQEDDGNFVEELDTPVAKGFVVRSFLVSVTAAIGSSLRRGEQVQVSQKVIETVSTVNHSGGDVSDLPHGMHLYDVMVDVVTGRYKSFASLLDTSSLEDLNPMRVGDPDVVVPTATTVRNSMTLASLISAGCGSMVMLVGPPGCGKSMVIADALSSMANVDLASMSFSSTTSPADILATLRAHATVQKLPSGNLCLRPKTPGSKIVLFCDEVNLGSPDVYGTQTAACFLRQLLGQGGFWGEDPASWIRVEGLQIVAACNPPELAGRQALPPRLLRHTHVMRVQAPAGDDLSTIFGVLNKSLLHAVDPRFVGRTSGLTSAMVHIYEANQDRFSPADSGPLQPHYVYSPRDLSRWLRGMRHILLERGFCGTNSDSSDGGAKRSARGRMTFSPVTAGDIEGDIDTTSGKKCLSWGDVLSALVHEARRLFVDRLMTETEREFAENVILASLTEHLGFSKPTLRDQWYSAWPKRHHRRHNTSSDVSVSGAYQPVRDLSSLRKVVYRKLRAFCEEEGLGGAWMSGSGANESAASMIDQFAVTDDVLRHLTRIERVLRLPLGHAVLIGAPGSGKKTLARFAAWMGGLSVHQVRSHAGYTADNFADDLRNVLQLAGVSGARVVMIFDESNALDGEFLEMMNAILACGDVPGLFEGEARIALLSKLRKQDLGIATSSTDEALYKKFIYRVRMNLHVVFTLSCDAKAAQRGSGSGAVPIGAELLSRSPALYNRCVVDWMGDWDAATLETVADLKLEVVQGSEKEAIVKAAVQIHECASTALGVCPGAARFTTPRHYLEFVEQVNRITLEKARDVQDGASRLKNGLNALRSAGAEVDALKQSLNIKTEELMSKENEANETLAAMAEEQRLAEKAKVDAEALAIQAQEAASAAAERKNEVAGLLAEVEPKVEAARNAVGSIRKENLEELRAMPNPPAGARLALQAVMMLLDTASSGRPVAPLAWQALRSRMRGTDLIRSVLNFDPDAVPPEVVGRLRDDILNNESFDVGRISYSSRAAGPLAEWTLASLEYAEVNESIAPLREEAEELEREKEECVVRKVNAEGSVSKLIERIGQCKLQYAALVSEAESVRFEISEAEAKLQTAEQMVESLGGEWDRWMSDLSVYNESAEYVWGNAVLGAAFVAYAGALDEEGRESLLRNCQKLLEEAGVESERNLCLADYLSTAEERSAWTHAGLAMDENSVQSYAILKRSARYPLIVDPSRRMDRVVRAVVLSSRPSGSISEPGKAQSSRGAERAILNKTSFAATGKQSYLRVIESAMRFGTAVLVEDAEQFDQSIAAVLGQEATTGDVGDSASVESGVASETTSTTAGLSHRLVRLGDRDVDQNPSFRLFMMTSDLSATPPAAISRSCVVSFSFSKSNLQTRCLSSTLRHVSPELEIQRSELVATRSGNERRKLVLESELLGALAGAAGDGEGLLEGKLLSTLQKLKTEAVDIASSIASHGQVMDEVLGVAAKYEPVAKFAVDIFFALQKLRALNSLYNFSPDFFLSCFEKCVNDVCSTTSDGRNELGDASRIESIRKELLSSMFLSVAPSLFPGDQLPFAASLALVACDDPRSQEIFQIALRSVLSIGNAVRLKNCDSEQDPVSKVVNAPIPEVVSAVALACKSNPASATGLVQEISRRIPGADSSIVHNPAARPDQALRGEILSYARSHTPCEEGGPQTGKVHAAAVSTYPLLLCARGSGVDPSALVSVFCAEAGLPCESLAVGDTESLAMARSALDYASQRWGSSRSSRPGVLLIKNMHLAPNECVELVRREILKYHGTPPYLLILVSEVGRVFVPLNIANLGAECRVLAFEAPCDFRATLSRSVAVAKCGSASREAVNSFLPTIAWLHTSVIERCRYAPTGLSEAYEFSESDLVAACATVHSLFGGSVTGSKAVLSGILVDCVYGGRVGSAGDAAVVAELVRNLINRVDPIGNSMKTQVFDGVTPIELPSSASKLTNTVESLPLVAPAAWVGLDSRAELELQARAGLKCAQLLARICIGEQ